MSRLGVVLIVGLLALLPACNRGTGEAETTTTTTTMAQAAAAETTTTTSGAVEEQASGTTVVPSRPEYSILSRTPGDSGDTVVVLIEPGDYTELQLESVIRDVVETYAPVQMAHLIDDDEAAEAVLAAEPTPEQQAVLDDHYLARLEDGLRLLFLGPYDEYQDRILGS